MVKQLPGGGEGTNHLLDYSFGAQVLRWHKGGMSSSEKSRIGLGRKCSSFLVPHKDPQKILRSAGLAGWGRAPDKADQASCVAQVVSEDLMRKVDTQQDSAAEQNLSTHVFLSKGSHPCSRGVLGGFCLFLPALALVPHSGVRLWATSSMPCPLPL